MSTFKEEFMVNREKFMEEIDDLLSGWPVWLSVTQSAEILNISRTSVYRLLEGGDLDAIRINLTGDRKPSVRIPAESVRKLFTSWVGDSND